MSSLIKLAEAEASGVIRRIKVGVLSQPAEAWGDPENLNLRGKIDRLHAELASKSDQIENLIEVGRDAFREGVAAGRAEGLQEAAAERSDIVDALARTSEVALATFSSEIKSLDRLAPRIAFEVLDRILGDPDHLNDHLPQLISHQLKGLEASSIVQIEVSQDDFPSPTELGKLQDRLGSPRLEIKTASQLAPGACRIKLRLGTIEVGMNQQWGHMAELLLTMTEATS